MHRSAMAIAATALMAGCVDAPVPPPPAPPEVTVIRVEPEDRPTVTEFVG